jgi:2-dehydropantoate 2-reductase
MKVAIVGAGAMGGSLAAHAARAGHEVTVVDTSSEVVGQITDHGIDVQAPDGSFLVTEVAATGDTTTVGVVDVIVLFVKAQHTESAARSLKPLIGPETAVATLQNGWGNADRLAQVVPVDQLVVGVTYNSCTLRGPGQVVHSGRGPTVTGPYNGTDLRFASKVAEVLTSSGWVAEATAAVRTEIWKKLILNCATLPTAALSRLNAGALGEPGELRNVVDAITTEAVAVAAAQGLDIDPQERIDTIHGVLKRAGAGKASMLQDVLAGRKTEIETVNGAVVAAGAEYGVPVPLNQVMVALVHGLERSYLS